MTDEDVWPRDMRSIQQGMQVGSDADAILRSRRGFAKSATRAVVNAHPGIACNGGRHPPPLGGRLARARFQHHRWGARTRAVEKKTGSSPLRQLTRHSTAPAIAPRGGPLGGAAKFG